MSEEPPEKEYSALQALLQIRTNSSQEERTMSRSEDTTMNAAANVAPSVAAAASNANAAVEAQVQQLLRLYSPNNQLAAVRAAAMTAANPVAAAVNRSHLYNSIFQNQTYPSLVAAAAATHSPLTSPIRPAAASVPLTTGVALPVMAASSVGHSTTAPQVKKNEETKSIRKDEVEAALRSKPQRGRKRENLNAEERLELTRTRNREHAKSTRIRKKARYQELLDMEQKYIELTNGQELDSKRRETILSFLEARAYLLQQAVGRINNEPRKDAATEEIRTTTDKENTRSTTENRAVSFDHTEKEKKPAATVKQYFVADSANAIPGELLTFLEEPCSFLFETSLAGIDAQGVPAMLAFDEQIAQRFRAQLCSQPSGKVTYQVMGSSNEIALNKNGTGFARVGLSVASNQKKGPNVTDEDTWEQPLLTSLVSFQFAPTSTKIKAVSWSVLMDATIGHETKSEATGKESLDSQTVYPSVVSFDESHRDKAKEHGSGKTRPEKDSQEPSSNDPSDHNEEPGMNIE